jgi:hypothetical protein
MAPQVLRLEIITSAENFSLFSLFTTNLTTAGMSNILLFQLKHSFYTILIVFIFVCPISL